jgi:hypothetical protein
VIIWKGWGVLAVLLAVAGFFAGILISDNSFMRGTPQATYPVAAGMVIAAAINWFAGRALNRTRREVEVSKFNRHSLFWIPMEWWSLPMAFVAILLFFRLGPFS